MYTTSLKLPALLGNYFVRAEDRQTDIRLYRIPTYTVCTVDRCACCPPTPPQGLPNDRTETYLKAIREAVKPNETQLVVTIVPQMRADRYSAIKKLCYLETPVASQVVVQRTISNERKLTSITQKIILQINCKLGGELWGSRSAQK